AADVDDVDQPRAGGDEVGTPQARRRLREREPGPVDEPAARHAELSGERGQREHRADAAAAVPVALEPVADGDDCWAYRSVPVSKLLYQAFVDAADPRRVREGVTARERHVVLEAFHVAGDELAVQAAPALEVRCDRPGQDDVRSGPQRYVEIGLLGDLRTPRVDDDELGARAPRAIDDRHDMEI